jgi:hypothetical protein
MKYAPIFDVLFTYSNPFNRRKPFKSKVRKIGNINASLRSLGIASRQEDEAVAKKSPLNLGPGTARGNDLADRVIVVAGSCAREQHRRQLRCCFS